MMWITSMSLYKVPSMPRHYAGRREDDRMSATTLHLQDTDLEIHELVVGPVDNNVYVLRCRHTGDAVLIDAANARRAAGVDGHALLVGCADEGLIEPVRGQQANKVPEEQEEDADVEQIAAPAQGAGAQQL